MRARVVVDQAGWLIAVGLVVSAHRLAVGFVLSDGSSSGSSASEPWTSAVLLVLGGLSAIVLTGAQMVLASTLTVVRDRLLGLA